ncbi:transposase, partial [Thermotalea metallivorans]|uniref:transposase n=1 Tax=Thermotalea metallivorans TaxID=520762 RepID=UPI000837B646
MTNRRTFTEDFKTMIADLVQSGKTVKEVCSEYSLSETAVRSWVKKKSPINIEGDVTSLEEIKKIKKEIAKL